MKQYPQNKDCVLMTASEVRAFDEWAINTLGIPGPVLMENAGRSCAELIVQKLRTNPAPSVAIFCGTGNNGGDGFVIARHLINANLKVTTIVCGDLAKIKGDAKLNLDLLIALNHPPEKIDPSLPGVSDKVSAFTHNADMIVDAIFGTGFKSQLRNNYVELIESINARNIPILAVDIPSGLDCDTGQPLPVAIKAESTVTFAAAKTGFANPVAADYTGQIFIASIGVEPV